MMKHLVQTGIVQQISLREVEEVLNRQQPLRLEMIRRLHSSLGMSAQMSIQTILFNEKFSLIKVWASRNDGAMPC
ncbi:MAG: hypothetical protein RMX96_27565 [Nostoc sp. ChiSLP02]|nr:hypothetical protein [Nostoc sp. DedSLP01]MDZ8188600.1 hypothetical protein [Nostoc sp. ChiSLP02]